VSNAGSRRTRHLVVIAALAVAALVVPAVASAMPGTPLASPKKHLTVAQVQRELGHLALRNSQLVDKFDQAQMDVQHKQAAAQTARRAAAKADAAFQVARAQLGATATAMYEGGSFSATGALLSSDSGEGYLDQLQTLSMISTHTAQVVSNLVLTRKSADAARQHANTLLSVARTKRNELLAQRKAVQKQLNKYSALLDTLTAAQRVTYLHQANPALSNARINTMKANLPHATSAAAAQAVKFALAQVGKPYVFGAAGPDSYDCSGLTMAAWASAGVSLPHSAADQYNYGHHVSFNDLQPGDLLFYYQPIGHVTIYVGNGLMVSAPETGENVSVVPATQSGSDFVGATRLTN
jgi:cell wall-associated NlpC family hydrolase